MPDAITQAGVRSLNTKSGVLMKVVTVSADLTEESLKGSLGIVKTARSELFRAMQGAVDWLESVEQMPFKIAREAIQRTDKLSSDALEGVESISLAVTNAMRASGVAATEMMSQTAGSLVGGKSQSSETA